MSEILERFERLRRHLGTNINDMEGEYRDTPVYLMEAIELAAFAERVRDTAKHNIEVVEANAAVRLRDTEYLITKKEPSQARIDRMLPLDAEVQTAHATYHTAAEEARVCDGLVDTLKSQYMAVHRASEMVMSGHFNPTALSPNRERARVREAFVPRGGRVARPIE